MKSILSLICLFLLSQNSFAGLDEKTQFPAGGANSLSGLLFRGLMIEAKRPEFLFKFQVEADKKIVAYSINNPKAVIIECSKETELYQCTLSDNLESRVEHIIRRVNINLTNKTSGVLVDEDHSVLQCKHEYTPSYGADGISTWDCSYTNMNPDNF